MKTSVKLTQYSHGAGCGCKIAPDVLNNILHTNSKSFVPKELLVGNDIRDDAAVYAINDEQAIISTTDFFMPIVDDPFDFGSIAAVNAISDVYAMGGRPIMAIAILGWPVDKIDPSIAGIVMEGAREICTQASIPLAGGHSIDTVEPIFGLAVSGMVQRKFLKTNNAAKEGARLYLTKPLGIGILTTAQKREILKEEDFRIVREIMLTLNNIGPELAEIEGVCALTDVTGFGLLGHLLEICEGSKLSAKINFKMIPKLENLSYYLEQKTVPGGTFRNYKSYSQKISPLNELQKVILCDPQTSGGLLIAVQPKAEKDVQKLFKKHNLNPESFGTLVPAEKHSIIVESD